MDQKKILILYTSVGLGHKSIAENIGFYLSGGRFVVKCADIGQVQKGRFEKVVVAVHQFINRQLPFVWGWLYDWGHYIILPFRTFIAGFNYKLTKKYIDEFQPDLIITTQTTASAVVAFLKTKGLYKNLFAVAFSDYHLHPYWLYKQADFYLANIEEQKREMVGKGISGKKIIVCGIILKPKPQVNIIATKTKLGIADGEKVVLISSGSLGSGIDSSVVEKFAAQPGVRPVVVCGKNQQVFNSLSIRFAKTSAVILGFYQPMDELYAIADIFITKPGGLSVAEALSWNLPILISHHLPGQEVYNYNYLLARSLVMPKTRDIFAQALDELKTGGFRRKLEANSNLSLLFNGASQAVAALENLLNSQL